MSRVNKFTESQLRKFGFHKDPEGKWSKDRLQAKSSRTSAPNVEPSPRRKAEGPSEEKEARKGSLPKGVRFRLIIHSYRTRMMDPSNACFKALEDCLTEAGVIPDDGPDFCDQPLFLQTKVKKGQEHTDIEVLCYREEAA